MRQDNRKTSSATRQARIKGNAGGSQPRPRPTQVSTMKQQGPLKPKATTAASQRGGNTGTARVTSSNRAQSPRLPNLPKNPVRGTTNTIRATGGGSNYNAINRLSAQAAKAAPSAVKGAAKAVGKGVLKAVGTRAAVFAAGLQGGKLNPGTLAYNQKLAAKTMKDNAAKKRKPPRTMMGY